jgi:hypothetical protein
MSLQKLGALLLLWLSFSSNAGADFAGPVVSILDGDTIDFCITITPSVSASAVSTALKRVRHMAAAPSMPLQF